MVHSNVMEPNHLRPGEVEICTIPDGGRFKMAEVHVDGKKVTFTHWVYGQKVMHNTCRAQVSLPATNSHHVVFGEGTTRRSFTASGAATVSWPTMVGVIPLTAEEYERLTQPAPFRQPYDGEKTGEMTDPKIVKAHLAKYKFQLTALAKATEAKDAAAIETAEARINAVTEAASAADVDVIAEFKAEQKAAKPNANQSVAPMPSAVKKAPAPKLTKREKMDATQEKRAAAKAAKPAKAPRVKKLAVMNTCLCGCGEECGGLFRPGHDARTKGLIYQVERGEAKFADLPSILQAHVKFAGRAVTAGKENGDYRIVQAPVKFPGRDDIKVIKPATTA